MLLALEGKECGIYEFHINDFKYQFTEQLVLQYSGGYVVFNIDTKEVCDSSGGIRPINVLSALQAKAFKEYECNGVIERLNHYRGDSKHSSWMKMPYELWVDIWRKYEISTHSVPEGSSPRSRSIGYAYNKDSAMKPMIMNDEIEDSPVDGNKFQGLWSKLLGSKSPALHGPMSTAPSNRCQVNRVPRLKDSTLDELVIRDRIS